MNRLFYFSSSFVLMLDFKSHCNGFELTTFSLQSSILSHWALCPVTLLTAQRKQSYKGRNYTFHHHLTSSSFNILRLLSTKTTTIGKQHFLVTLSVTSADHHHGDRRAVLVPRGVQEASLLSSVFRRNTAHIGCWEDPVTGRMLSWVLRVCVCVCI